MCCNNDLEQTITSLHSEWSKEIEPSGQSSTHHPLVVSNPIDKKGLEFMRRSMRWEAPWMPTSAHDPGLLREQETPIVIGKKFVPGPRDSSRWFHQNPRLVTGMGRASGRNENHDDGRSDYMPGPRTRMDNH